MYYEPRLEGTKRDEVIRKLYKNVSLVASVFLNGLELVTDP